ncbi:MAG TPA: flagellar assembly protein FliH [Noviherbaspirillum sp.]|nr:flagellar assembly protein FliH [Noviherbaspirillum sp.]
MVIPKEKLSAYQRWELASFGDDRPSAQHSAEAAAAATKQTAEQIAKMREQAQQQGYDEGHAEGYAQGRAAGLEAGRAEAAREAQRMRQIADTFGSEVARVDEAIANDVLELALDLAKAMLKTALKVRPELVLPIVSEAIRYLPSVQQPALLVLHPQDAELVRNHMADELAKAGWRVSEDPQMEPGGCHIETASNQIEASPAVRWQRIADALGKHSEWIE